jgi:DNA invertase Pin-like site-specific DNA recombinase
MSPAPSEIRSGSEPAWAYLVVSDQGQVETLADQRAWAEGVAARNGWLLTEVFSDVSTGREGARKLLQRVLERLRALEAQMRPKRLLMIRLDRLGRGDGSEAFEAFLKIRQLGVAIHTRQDGDVQYGRASELLMPMLRIFIGGMENEVRRDKAAGTYEKRRSLRASDPTIAIGSIAPYGLQIANGRYAEKAPEAHAVRVAYELRVQGYGHHIIAKRLHGIAAPWQLKNGITKVQKWDGTRVGRMLRNTAYRGVLVDDATWIAAQRSAREIRRPTIKNEYSLGGALRCECGYALAGHAGPGRGRKSQWRYYQCKNYLAHGRMRHHRSTGLEEQFVDLLRRLRAEEGLLEHHISGASRDDRKALMARLTEVRSQTAAMAGRRRRIFDAYEAGALKQQDLQWRLDDLHAEEQALGETARAFEEQLAVQRVHHGTLEHARSLVANAAEHWLAAGIEDRRALAKAVSAALGGLVVKIDGNLVLARKDACSEIQAPLMPRAGDL